MLAALTVAGGVSVHERHAHADGPVDPATAARTVAAQTNVGTPGRSYGGWVAWVATYTDGTSEPICWSPTEDTLASILGGDATRLASLTRTPTVDASVCDYAAADAGTAHTARP